MRQIGSDDSMVQLELTLDELLLMNDALNEICNGVHIEDWEFATRLGVDRAKARQLLSEVHDVLGQTPPTASNS